MNMKELYRQEISENKRLLEASINLDKNITAKKKEFNSYNARIKEINTDINRLTKQLDEMYNEVQVLQRKCKEKNHQK